MRFSAVTTVERLLPARLALRARPLLDALEMALLARDARGRAGRMSLIAFSIRIANALIAFVSQVLLARWMGGFEYGIFVLVWVTMIIVGSISCLGFDTAVIRFISEYREKAMWPELRGFHLTGRLLALITATIVAAIGLAVIWGLGERIEDYYLVPFALGLICLPMIALSDLLQGVARANSWAVAALSPAYLVRPVLILAFMAAAIATGFAPSAETAMLAAVAATYLTTLAQLTLVTGRVERQVDPGPRRYLLRHWVAISMPIFLVESFFFLLTNADVLMIGRFLPPGEVAVYFATVKTLALVHFASFAVKAGVAQRYAQISHGDDRAALEVFARETAAWTFWPSLAMALVVLVLGKPLLGLFGPGFDQGYPLLFVLSAGVVLRAAIGPAESLLTMTGNQNVCAAVYALTLGVNIALNFLLIPQFALWGAAIATAAAMTFEATALFLTVRRRLGITMSALPHRAARLKEQP
ncbi:lipopolysaccharide biosynthesis protein [Mesorhizobium xinjiangense]|uniref:lipopolysaccharide biosynthesis protein n=1 Tax=Mesorhizobium xinjiangense TaxID=2678685 RepID=UPI0012ED1457|nr:lipopolysaccharide biosynthesis protein [Mesorhizobium xinjiangense]